MTKLAWFQVPSNSIFIGYDGTVELSTSRWRGSGAMQTRIIHPLGYTGSGQIYGSQAFSARTVDSR